MWPEMIPVLWQYPQIQNSHTKAECRSGRKNGVDRFFGGTFPKNSQEKNHGQWWSNKTKHGLKHIKEVQSFDIVNSQGHHDGKQTTCNHGDPSYPDDITVACPGIDLLCINISGKYRAQCIQGRTDR